ncbi:MAG: hypothetical protein KKF89_02390 [Nanoarchaeota archaeon]|nr:hypothetical protein [Nanoarchaeota archaeon]MBU1854542.1 hypothetical protein [Nanoarchaeota archaeon]
MEFVILMTFMMLIFTVVFLVIQHKSISLNNKQTVNQVEALANVIKNEVDIAQATPYSYKKCFWIPEYINGQEYTIQINEQDLIIYYNGEGYFAFLNITKGEMNLNEEGYHTVKSNISGVFIEPGRDC